MMYRLELQKSIRVTGVSCVWHISHVTSDRVCISDINNLILTNTAGEDLHHLTDIVSGYGVHTVNRDSDLIYIDRKYSINKLSTVNKVKSTLIKYTAPWRPLCVYSSPSTGDLLVGMKNTDTWTGKVTRYNSTGEIIQTIQYDSTGQRLYSTPNYITENHNGDVIVSDRGRGVVVTEGGGRHRFSYTGPPSGSGLIPHGICTDVLSHILVCDYDTNRVQMIDKDGHFLSLILTPQRGIDSPYSLSYDDSTQLVWIGSEDSNTVNIYRCIYRDSLVGLPVQSLKCKKHPTYTVEKFCVECDVPLCVECDTSKEHRQHVIKENPRKKEKPSGYVVEFGDLPSGSTKNVPDPSDDVLPPPEKIRKTGSDGKLQKKKEVKRFQHSKGFWTKGRSRFAKLGMATNEVLNVAYRDILELEVAPFIVYSKVKASPVLKRLHPVQERLLQDAKYSGYKNFDISLIYTLIRNICSKIPKPTKGKWGEEPAAGEVTVGDDIQRIKSIQNSLTAHVSSASTSQTEFDNTWSMISDICQRLEVFTGKKYLDKLNYIQKSTLKEEEEDAIIEKVKTESQHETVSFGVESFLKRDNVGDKPWGDFSDDVLELKQKHREEQITIGKEENIKMSGTVKSEPSILQLGFRKHPLKHTEKQITRGIEAEIKESRHRVPMITPGISSHFKRSTSLSRIDSLERRTPRSELEIGLHRIEHIDCSDICGRSSMHCYPGTIELCNQFSIQGIMEWTRDCSEKLREARSQKCKCFVSLFCVLITFETKGILVNVEVNKLELIVKHFVDFAIESRNYILLSELVRLHGFQLDFKLETTFAKTSKMIDSVTVDTIVQSAKCMILRRYSSLQQNSIHLSLSYDCEKGNCVTIVLSYEGTIEMMDIGQERVMGKKLVFYNDTKPSDEASSIFKSFATSCSRETLPRVTAKVARKLFNKHSNLTMISASPCKSVGYSKGKHKLMKQPCILLLCRHKGYIPYGEEEFPRIIEDFEVDVQEGYCTFGMGGSLEMGGHIRRKGSKSSGSIGGFLDRNDKKSLITCAHVVLSVQELGNRDINSANNADEVEAYIRKTRSYQVCGKVVRAEFPNNSSPNECSVDAAIIELDSSFGNSDFRSVAAEQLISAGFDADNPVVFRGTVIPNERIHDISGSVVKFGARTGFTVGSLFHQNMHVRISIKESLKLFDILGSSEVTCEVNVYNQMEIEGLTEQFFEVGDSGSFVFCIQDGTISCIGMAIGLTTRGTCLVTPIENILKSFGLSVTDTKFFPAEAKLQSKIETDRILDAIAQIAQMQSSLQTDIDRRMEEQQKHLQEIKKDIEKMKKNE